MIAELGLRDWVKLDSGEDLDFVGPVAAAVFARHGLGFPANAHLHDPLFERARGGSLLTGAGGDQVFGLWQWSRAASVLARRVRPTPRDAIRVAYALTPAPVRRLVATQRATPAALPWLTPAAQREVGRDFAAESVSEPTTWPERVQWQATNSRVTRSLEQLDRMAEYHDCVVSHPLLDPTMVAAVGVAGGRFGYANRARAFEALFPGLHPSALATRATKAIFNDVFSREASLAAAAAWDGTGVPEDIVDVDRLKATWREGVPIRSALMLQQVTLQGTQSP